MLLNGLQLAFPVPTVLCSRTHRNNGCRDVTERCLLEPEHGLHSLQHSIYGEEVARCAQRIGELGKC